MDVILQTFQTAGWASFKHANEKYDHFAKRKRKCPPENHRPYHSRILNRYPPHPFAILHQLHLHYAVIHHKLPLHLAVILRQFDPHHAAIHQKLPPRLSVIFRQLYRQRTAIFHRCRPIMTRKIIDDWSIEDYPMSTKTFPVNQGPPDNSEWISISEW
jgi:hypothetical protein